MGQLGVLLRQRNRNQDANLVVTLNSIKEATTALTRPAYRMNIVSYK